MNGYQALANGIIEQAVKDYRDALRRLKKHPDDKAAMKEAMELEEFFHSSWYGVLTQVDHMMATLKEMSTKTTSIMQDDVVSHTRNVHSMEDAIAKMVDMQTEINADIDQLIDKKQEIMHTIYAVENPEYQTLLELRYICFRSWEEIADKMHCTVSNVFKVHSKALRCVAVPKLGS